MLTYFAQESVFYYKKLNLVILMRTTEKKRVQFLYFYYKVLHFEFVRNLELVHSLRIRSYSKVLYR